MNPERKATWAESRNLLVVRLDGMGDMLMTTPAIRALKQSAPGRRVTLWTSTAAVAAARLVPEVDEVIGWDVPWMKRPPRHAPAADLALIAMLRDYSFDGAVIFGLHSQSPLPAALACYLAGIPLRLARCRENPYHLLTDWIPEDELEAPRRHDVRRQLDLADRIGASTPDERLSIRVPESSRQRAAHLVASLGFDGGPWCVLHPGATASSRRYPPESFAEAARLLSNEHGWRFAVTGSYAERELCEAVAAGIGPAAAVVDGLPIEDFAALIQSAPLLISNNTGPVHIAAAVGTPVVDLYALTNPQHTPWMVPNRTLSHQVPCRYCYRSVCPEGHHSCLRLVRPAEVAAAALDLTQTAPPPLRIGEGTHA